MTWVVICLRIVIFVLDEIQNGGFVYCTLKKEILKKYSGKEADCIIARGKYLLTVNKAS